MAEFVLSSKHQALQDDIVSQVIQAAKTNLANLSALANGKKPKSKKKKKEKHKYSSNGWDFVPFEGKPEEEDVEVSGENKVDVSTGNGSHVAGGDEGLPEGWEIAGSRRWLLNGELQRGQSMPVYRNPVSGHSQAYRGHMTADGSIRSSRGTQRKTSASTTIQDRRGEEKWGNPMNGKPGLYQGGAINKGLLEAMNLEKGPANKASTNTNAWRTRGSLVKSSSNRCTSVIPNQCMQMKSINTRILPSLLPPEKQTWPGGHVYNGGKAAAERGGTSAYIDMILPKDISVSLGCLDIDDLFEDDGCDDDNNAVESDWVESDVSCSDGSKVCHETMKKDRRLRQFFDTMDSLTLDQLNEHERQWHCPACHGGVGAIDWYRGLQPLLAHANTIRSKKVKLHRDFAKTLDEELKRRGTSSGESEGMFGKWKGPRQDDEATNPLVVWPPSVIVQNTRLELDDQENWIGTGKNELLDHFKGYNVQKARYAYGPQGHHGRSILVFPESPAGYMEVQQLDKQFKAARRGRLDWEKPGKSIFYPGGKRILYAYIAIGEDLDIFNKHAGTSKLKWSLRRLNEVVVQPLRQMHEDNQQLSVIKGKAEKEKWKRKTLAKTVSLITNKLRLRDEEVQSICQRALKQHNENQSEMDQLEYHYKNKINQLIARRAEQEGEFMQKEEHFKEEQIQLVEELARRQVEIPLGKEEGNQLESLEARLAQEIAHKSELIETSLKDLENYELEKRELEREHHKKRADFMRRQYGHLMDFERQIEKEKMEFLEVYLHRRRS